MTSARFRVELTSRAQKDLKKLRHDLTNALEQISVLESDPYRGERLKGALREARSLHFSLKGGGQFRAVYVVLDDETICLVFLVAARESVYEEAERRFRSLQCP